MIAHNLLAIILLLGVLTLCAVPRGKFIAKVLSAQSGKKINEPLYDHLFISKKEAKEQDVYRLGVNDLITVIRGKIFLKKLDFLFFICILKQQNDKLNLF